MDPYERLLRDFFRLIGELWLARIAVELQKFADALDTWLHDLFAHPTPAWRTSFEGLLAEQAAEGRMPTPESRQELLTFLEGWAEMVNWNPAPTAALPTESAGTGDDWSTQPAPQHHHQPSAALWYAFATAEKTETAANGRPVTQPESGGGRGDQSQFAREAEEIVSEATGLARNQGPRRQTIPGSGPKGIRIPDFPVRGPEGSVRLRGTIVEVKASRGAKFGDLSGLSRQQIKDAVKYAQMLRERASLVKDPAVKFSLQNAHVEVFSDLPQPKSGYFAKLIERELLTWRPIPRSGRVAGTVRRGAGAVGAGTPRSIGNTGLDAAKGVALGLVISLAEAGVADSVYRDAARALQGLLNQIAANSDAKEEDWLAIQKKLDEIANMKQSALGYFMETLTYGQGSLKEKQGMAIMLFAWELGDKFGYQNRRTWGDVFRGGFGRFEKKQ